jgi:hypothetical protein
MMGAVHFSEMLTNHLPCTIWRSHGVLMKTQVSWNVTPCRLLDHEDGGIIILSNFLTVYPSTRYNITADLDLHWYCCQNLKSCNNDYLQNSSPSQYLTMFSGKRSYSYIVYLHVIQDWSILHYVPVKTRDFSCSDALLAGSLHTKPVTVLVFGSLVCFVTTAPLHTTVLSRVWRYSSTHS